MCEIDEPEELRIDSFLGGLREDLREKVEVIQNLTYEGACNSALIFEKSAKRKAAQPTPLINRMRENSSNRTPAQNPAHNLSVSSRTAAQ